MSILDHDNENRPMHLQSLPEAAGKVHAERMMEKEKNLWIPSRRPLKISSGK